MVKVARFDRNRKTILVVCHEGSRTGAPIIGYNLISGLSKTYNVVALFLETGPVALACQNLDVTVATSYYRCRDWTGGESLVEKLTSETDFEFAIVNSIEFQIRLAGSARSRHPDGDIGTRICQLYPSGGRIRRSGRDIQSGCVPGGHR